MQYSKILRSALAIAATATSVAADKPFVEATLPYEYPPYLFYSVDGAITSYQYMGVDGIFARVFTRDLPDTSRCLPFEPPLTVEDLASRLKSWVNPYGHDNCLLAIAPPRGDLEGQTLETMGITFETLQEDWARAQERVVSEDFQNAIKGSPLDQVHEDDLAAVIMMILPAEKERIFWLFIPALWGLAEGINHALEDIEDEHEAYHHYEDTVNQVEGGEEAPAPGPEHMGDYIKRPDGIWETLDSDGEGVVLEVQNGMKILLNEGEELPRWVKNKMVCKTPHCAYEYTE